MNNEILQKIAKPYQEYLDNKKLVTIDDLENIAKKIVVKNNAFGIKTQKEYIHYISYQAMGLNISNINLKLQNLDKSSDNDVWEQIKGIDAKLAEIFDCIKNDDKKSNLQEFKDKLTGAIATIVESKRSKKQEDALIDQKINQGNVKIFENQLDNLIELLKSDNFVTLMSVAVDDTYFINKIFLLLCFCEQNFVTVISEIDKEYNNIIEKSSQIEVIKKSHYINYLFYNVFWKIGYCFSSYPKYCRSDFDAIETMIRERIINTDSDKKIQSLSNKFLQTIMQPYQNWLSSDKFSSVLSEICNDDYFENHLTYQAFCDHNKLYDTLQTEPKFKKGESISYYLTHFAIELDFALAYIKQQLRDNSNMEILKDINYASSELNKIFSKIKIKLIDEFREGKEVFDGIADHFKILLKYIKNLQIALNPAKMEVYESICDNSDNVQALTFEEECQLRLARLKNLFSSDEFTIMNELCEKFPNEQCFIGGFHRLVYICALDFFVLIDKVDKVLFGDGMDEFYSEINLLCPYLSNQALFNKSRIKILTDIEEVNRGLNYVLEISKKV